MEEVFIYGFIGVGTMCILMGIVIVYVDYIEPWLVKRGFKEKGFEDGGIFY